MTDSKFAA